MKSFKSFLNEGENKQVKGGDPCWSGYEMVGKKKKNGKEVPNCVPVKEESELEEARVAASASARSGLAKRSAGEPKKSNLSTSEQAAKNKESDDSFARLMAHVNAHKAKQKVNEDWQKVNKADNTDGMSQKAVNAYRRENPGSKLKTAVTEKNPTGKRASRRASFCARMGGMKKRLTKGENARDPDSPINKALRRWRC